MEGWLGACTAVIARGPCLGRAMCSAQTLGTSKPSKGASVKQVYSYSLWLKGDARTEGNLDVVQRVHECSCSFLFFFTWVNDMQSLKQTKTKHNKTTRTPNANPCTVSLKAQRKEVGGQSRGTQMLQELTYEIMKPHFQLFFVCEIRVVPANGGTRDLNVQEE